MNAQGIDDRTLVAALQTGEDWAYEHIVRTYGGRLLAVARRILRDEEEARDALQTAYLAAFRSVGRFEGGSQVATWLHRVVVNAALMKLRSRRRHPEESIEPLLPTFLADGHHSERFSARDLRPDLLLEQASARAAVRACIDRLPDTYRTVLILRDVEEVDTPKVAELLGTTPNAVKVRLHRARQALATLLRETGAGLPASNRREDRKGVSPRPPA